MSLSTVSTVLHRLAPEPRVPRRYVGRHRAPGPSLTYRMPRVPNLARPQR